MKRLTDLKFLFRVVAILELCYTVLAVLLPPSMVRPATGWVLSVDGQWITKLLGMSLGCQALIAWLLRDTPHRGVALALALYQIGSATVDWVMWLVLADQGIFSSAQARAGVIFAIPTHYTVGVLLLLALRAAPEPPRA